MNYKMFVLTSDFLLSVEHLPVKLEARVRFQAELYWTLEEG